MTLLYFRGGSLQISRTNSGIFSGPSSLAAQSPSAAEKLRSLPSFSQRKQSFRSPLRAGVTFIHDADKNH